jgi:hypothetical protein
VTILPQLEDDLRRAGRRRDPRAADATRGRTLRPGLLGRVAHHAAALGSLAVVLVIAGAAIVLLHGPSKSRRADGSSSQPATTRQQLVDTIGLLRRPQKAADLSARYLPPFVGQRSRLTKNLSARSHRALLDILHREGDPQLQRSLVRVVVLPRLHATVALTPVTYRPGASSARIEGVYLNVHTPDTILQGPGPISAAQVLSRGVGMLLNPTQGHILGFFLVPDQVARVSLSAITPTADSGLSPGNRDTVRRALAGEHRTVTVQHNLAAFRLPAPPAVRSATAISGALGVQTTADETWYSATGSVLARFRTPLDVTITIHGRNPSIARFKRAGGSAFCHQNPTACPLQSATTTISQTTTTQTTSSSPALTYP